MFRLALALGMTVNDLLTRITSHELSEWMAYASIEPFGEERADLRAGQICAVIANANRDTKHRPQPFSPADFMPFLERPEPTTEDIAAKVALMMGA